MLHIFIGIFQLLNFLSEFVGYMFSRFYWDCVVIG